MSSALDLLRQVLKILDHGADFQLGPGGKHCELRDQIRECVREADTPRELARGWGPVVGRRAHYFPLGDSMSLCRRIGFYFGPRDDGMHDSPDNCAACRKARAKLP